MNQFERYAKRLTWFTAVALTAFVAGCGGGDDGGGGGGPGPGGGGTPANTAGVVCDSNASAGCVNLGTAGTYAILGQAGTTNTGTSAITGNIGTSPAASTATTGFGTMTNDASNTFATAPQVNGKMYASDNADPTPANLGQAVADSITAYGDAAGRAPTDTNGGGDLGGQNVGPGVHQSNGNVTINTPVTLTGGPNDVFIFQVNGTLTQAPNTQVILAGGALAKNVFWQVANGTDIGAGSTFEGIIITGSTVNLGTAATLHGRVLSAGAVTLDSNTVTVPQ